MFCVISSIRTGTSQTSLVVFAWSLTAQNVCRSESATSDENVRMPFVAP